jgi:dTDP-4-dehydrorhamnose reductase
MKVLISGAQGQVGKELVAISQQQGLDVIAAGRKELDITQLKSVEDYIQSNKPEMVINAAAYTAVDKAEDEQDIAYAINKNGAENLATACKEHNIPLLHISTDYVFDGTKKEAYSENDEVSPLGVYGESKWQGEEAIRQQLPQHIILRVAWVFGAQGNNFVKTILRLSQERNELNVVADQFGGPSPAKNIAETLISLARQYQKENTLEWGTYHYCGTEKTNWCEFAKEIFKQAKEQGLIEKEMKVNAITTTEYPTPAKRPVNSMLDCSKIKNTFGIEMPNWKKALKEVVGQTSV